MVGVRVLTIRVLVGQVRVLMGAVWVLKMWTLVGLVYTVGLEYYITAQYSTFPQQELSKPNMVNQSEPVGQYGEKLTEILHLLCLG